MVPSTKPKVMGAVMTVFNSVVSFVVLILQPLVLIIMAIARAIIVRHSRYGHAQSDDGTN